jgi:hypothetical protein
MPQNIVEMVPDAAENEADNESETTETEDAILEALQLTEVPIKARGIAKACARPYTSHFRQAVYDLVKKGKVIQIDGWKYWLAGRPLPAGQEGQQ